MQRSQLPARELEVVPAFRRKQWIALVVLGVLSALPLAVIVVTLGGALDIRRDGEVWAHGVAPETPASIDATSNVKFVFVSYKLDVRYATPAGEQHHDADIETILGTTNLNQRGTLRYDPAHPDRFAVSWAVGLAGARWAFVGVMCAVMLGFLVVMLLGIRQMWRAMHRTIALARDGDEIVAEVLAIKQQEVKGKPQLTYVVTWRASADQAKPFASVVDSARGTLAWTGKTQHALALLSADRSRGFLLRSDLYPLALTDEERERVQRWLVAQGGGTARGPLCS